MMPNCRRRAGYKLAQAVVGCQHLTQVPRWLGSVGHFRFFFFFFKSAWNYASMQDGEKGIKPNGMTSCDVSEFSFSFGGFSAKKKKKNTMTLFCRVCVKEATVKL